MKKWSVSIFTILLVLSVIVPFIPKDAFADTILIGGQSINIGDEVLASRTGNSKTFYRGKVGAYSSFEVQVSMGNVHYKDDYTNKSEAWKNIDTKFDTLSAIVNKAPYTLSVDRVNKTLTIAYKQTGSVISISLYSIDNKSVNWGIPTIIGNKVTWTNVAKDTDFQIIANENGIKLQRILKTNLAPLEAKFTYGQVGDKIKINCSATDAIGKFIPVQSTNINGILTETMNSTALIGAVYPIYVDPDITEQVGADADDIAVYWNGVWNWLSDTYIGFGFVSAASNYKVGSGMRWQTVNVPNSAGISTAHIHQYAASTDGTGTAKSMIVGDLEADAAAFTTLADYQARRGTDVGGADNTKRTTAEVAWDDIADSAVDTEFTSPEIKTIIQEIVNQGGWAANNDMVLFHDDHDDRTTHTNDYYRLLRANESASANSAKLHFTYLLTATVDTNNASSVEAQSATLDADIDDVGAGNATDRGFAWGTTSNATTPTSGEKPPASYTTNWSEFGSFGVGNFTHATGNILNTGTTYYYRGYAKNSAGWGWGDEVPFLTKPAAPTNVAATDGVHTSKVVVTWTKSTGADNYHVYRDGGDLGLVGDVATYDDNGADAGIITAGTSDATDGTSSLHVTLSVAGESVANGTTHTYKVVAQNATGHSADSLNNTGYRGVGAITYQWMRTSTDADIVANYANIGGGTTDPYNDTGSPAPTISGGTGDATDGTSAAHVTLSVSLESATAGAGRWFLCTISATGTASANTTTNRGYRGTTTLTYQWQRSAADANAAFAPLAGATTDPFNDTTGAIDPDGRWYYCVISMVGAADADSTHNRGYRMAVTITVETHNSSGVGRNWSVVNGEFAVSSAGTPTTMVGFQYGLTVAYGQDVTQSKIITAGTEFKMTLSPLAIATVYHFRAMAQVGGVWYYGLDSTFATQGSPSLWEAWNTGCDTTSSNITGNSQAFQTFTSNETAHTVTSIRVNIKRTGSPGNVVMAITHATGLPNNVPTGADIATSTLNGNAMSDAYTWYEFTFTPPVSLEANQPYAIVLRAISGTNPSNNIQWCLQGAGGYGAGNAGTTTDGGITYTATAPDALFEVWGYASLQVSDARVFTDYIEDSDWLVVAIITNTYAPYYNNSDDPSSYFQFQLVDASNNVRAATPVNYYDRNPIGLYLDPSITAPLTWGGEYYVRIQLLSSATAYQEYPLAAIDWKGDNMTFLDQWIRTTAVGVADYYNDLKGLEPTDTGYITYLIATADKGTVLSEVGGVLYARGIPELTRIRPDIFQSVKKIIAYTAKTFSGAGTVTDWETSIGAKWVTMFEDSATVLGSDSPKTLAGIFLLLIYCVIAVILGLQLSPLAGLGLGIPVLALGWSVGIMNSGLFFITIMVMVFMGVWSLFAWRGTG